MKRYLVLSGELYYPDGGRDIKSLESDFDVAVECAKRELDYPQMWSEVFDLATMEVVKRFYSFVYYAEGERVFKIEEDDLDN